MMKIRFNDAEMLIKEQSSLQQVVESQNKPDHYAVAVNRRFIPRANYAATHLQDGDVIEIITPMQGG